MKIDEIGSLLASLVLVTGLVKLPAIGFERIEEIFTFSWLILGTLIFFAFFRKIIRKRK